jgi:CRP-like cAMP-binding protein
MKHETFAANAELVHALDKVSQQVSCSDGCTLFTQGQVCTGLYILRSGEAALVLKSAMGQRVKCLTIHAGSLIGLPGVVGVKPYTLTAMVRPGSQVRFVTRADFERIIEAEPSLYPGVLHVLAAEVRAAQLALFEIQITRDNSSPN